MNPPDLHTNRLAAKHGILSILSDLPGKCGNVVTGLQVLGDTGSALALTRRFLEFA